MPTASQTRPKPRRPTTRPPSPNSSRGRSGPPSRRSGAAASGQPGQPGRPGKPGGQADQANQANQGAAGELVDLATLTKDPANRRLHPERNLQMITESLQAVGAARSIVLDESNTALAGNGVLEAAAA